MALREFILKIAGKFKKTRTGVFDENLFRELQERILKLEKRQYELEKSLKKEPCVDNIVVERLYTEKIELNFDAIDIKELSGMLSIGLNYDGKLVKLNSGEIGETKEDGKNTNDKKGTKIVQTNNNGSFKDIQAPKPKIKVYFDNQPLSNN
ncbi:MAG: hypothetical protein WBK73_11585 [Tepidanaerobacteraceae bacterium]